MRARPLLYAYLCLLGTLFSGLLMGCDGSNSVSNRDSPDMVLIDFLPDTTRGFLLLPAPRELIGKGWEDFPAGELGPWRHHPVDILRYYSGSLDLVNTADQLVLAQPTNSGDEYVLLIDIDKEEGEALFDAADLVGAGKYRGFSVHAISGTGLFVARLNDRTWEIAPRSSMEKVIDVLLGSLPNIRHSAIADYLENLDEGQPINAVYGLPGLYKSIVPPGSGTNSLSQATVVRAAFSVEDDLLDGQMQFVTANAVGYTQRLLGLQPELGAASIEAAGDRITIDLAGLSASGDIHSLLKSLFHGMDAIDYSEAIIHGGNLPWMNFKVGENPNSIFINFEFRDKARREAFAAEHLPPGFSLAPIRILDMDEPRYFLVLNVYRSSGGLVEGARAEWSVFVSDPDSGKPRFLVVQAAAESISADPVNLLTLPEPVSHVLASNAIESYVGLLDKATGEQTTYFSSRIRWPQLPQRLVSLHREFSAANDYIYWGNAVADRGLHNATVHNSQAVLIEADSIDLVDNSRWAQYISAEPVHTLVYRNPLDIVISPWWNLDAGYLAVSEDYRQQLINFKNGFYPMTVLGLAEAAMRGGEPVPSAFTTGETLPTSYFHFVVNDPAGLFSSVGAGDKFTPLAIALHDNEALDYYLSLVVYERKDDPCGFGAEWVTYVLTDNGRPKTLQLDTLGSDACLDPVSLLGLPSVVELEAGGEQLYMRLSSPFVRFAARVDVTRGEDVLLGLDWVEAGDQVCSLNGICDSFFYDGQLLVEHVMRIDAGAVTIDEFDTPWSEFIQTRPAEVVIQKTAATFGTNPWKNVPAF